MPLYFCVGQVLSVHICFDVTCQLCFGERSGMRWVLLQRNDNVILKHLREKFALLPQIGLQVVLRCLFLIIHQRHSAKLSSIYINRQVIKGSIKRRTFDLNQLIHSFNCVLSACVQSLTLKTLPFLCSFTNLKEQMNLHMAKWYYLVVFSGLLPAQLSGLFGQELKAHVKWCDVRVGASRRCCCEWPLDVTCQWAREGGMRRRERERGEMQERAGGTTLALIQLLRAEQHWLSPRSWKRGDRVKVRKTEQERSAHSATDRERWEVLERRQEERFRAAKGGRASCCVGQCRLSTDITFVLKDSHTHTHTHSRVCRKPNTGISRSQWPDEGQQNRREEERRDA